MKELILINKEGKFESKEGNASLNNKNKIGHLNNVVTQKNKELFFNAIINSEYLDNMRFQ